MRCYLCQSENAHQSPVVSFKYEIDCEDCGRYVLTKDALKSLLDTPQAFALACWVVRENLDGSIPYIDEATVVQITTAPPPTTKRKVESLLDYVIRKNPGKIRVQVDITDRRLQLSCWTRSNPDAHSLGVYLMEMGAFEEGLSYYDFTLTTKGHLIHEEMMETRTMSSQAFVAMWFDNKMTSAYDMGIAPAIRGAGYEPIRIDRTTHAEKIDDRIIAEIRRSLFVVADFTGHRGGVYYEAGFAHGLGKKVIFTCLEKDKEAIHFDVRQYNTIMWENSETLMRDLQNRILAIFGAGPLDRSAKPLP
jgi:nucleoside 2-deoxyribosyltransferase